MSTQEQREAAAQRSRDWRAANPAKAKSGNAVSIAKRAERLKNDPEYRAAYNAAQRARYTPKKDS